jgi:hypothetical protein
MNLRKLFGFQKKATINQPQVSTNVLYLWEDDHLMIELLPFENLQFVKAETNRISQFAQEHFDGVGFTDITPIAAKPFKTIDKLIDIAEVENIMTTAGLKKITRFHMQGVGLIEGDKAPLGFGMNKFVVICSREKNLLKHIWISGQTNSEEERNKLSHGLLSFGQSFNFIGVNWFKCEYYNLVEKESVDEFVKNSC